MVPYLVINAGVMKHMIYDTEGLVPLRNIGGINEGVTKYEM